MSISVVPAGQYTALREVLKKPYFIVGAVYMRFLLGIILLSLSPATAVAENSAFSCQSELSSKKKASLLGEIEKQYQAFKDLSAEFTQRSYFIGLGDTVESTGTIRFKKPGMMDWTYQTPDEQRFVADGTTLWFYQPEQNQVTLGEFKNSFSSELPVSFLLGIGKLQERFTLESACESAEGIVAKLKGLDDKNLDEFYLLVDSKSKVPHGAKIVDIGGNETEIVFANVSFENSYSAESFRFDIPRGLDIIDQRSEEAKRARTSS